MSRDGGEDGWTSEYDSTWEDDEEEDGRRRTQRRPNYSRRWRNRAARDLQIYRHGYRGEHSRDQSCTGENPKTTPNLDFYQNKKCFEPNGLYIDDLLNEWKDDYTTLERNHSYIQWLFPLREYGMNSYAKPLTLHEIKMMKEDKDVMTRFLKAYKLMLQFYGIKLSSEMTGEVIRAENWEERFKNLNYHSHNNLRITRILKCLGEMGYGHFQAPLVRFLLEETLCKNNLPGVKRSVLDYFMFAVKDKHERRKLVHFAWKNYKPNNQQDRFIWGPVEKLKEFNPPGEENDASAGSEGRRDDKEKNPDSKTCKNRGKEPQINAREAGRAREDEVPASQRGSKMELMAMKDRGPLPENRPYHNAKIRSDQSTQLRKNPSGLEEDNTEEEKNDAKKEEHVDHEDAKEDRGVKEEVIKRSEGDPDGGLEVNGLSSHVQNAESKRNQGDHHRKRKMPDNSPMSPPADGWGAGDDPQTGHTAGPCRAEDEGGQVDGVEDEVKKLKLKETQTTCYLNRTEEGDRPADADPREVGKNLALPSVEHSEDPHPDE